MTQQPEQSVGCRFWDGEKQICRALTELVCADRRCSMRLTEEEHAESCKRAAAAEKDITALARRAIDGFQDSKFITPCRWCAEREQCDLLTNGANTCFKWRGPQEGANQ